MIKYCSDFFYKLCIAPKSSHEDTKRHEFILNVILIGIIPFLIIVDICIDFATHAEGKAYRGIPFLSLTCIAFLFIWLLFMSRKGYYRLASFALLGVYFTATTYAAIHWGVDLPFVIVSYIIVIIISSILISTRFAFISTSVITLTITIIGTLQIQGFITPLIEWKHTSMRINDCVEISVILFLITTLSWISNRETEASLVRARNSEHALLEERNLLEIKIEERTKELKEMQHNKIAQLYRFAEFGRLSSGVFHDLMNALNVVVANVTQLEDSMETLPSVQNHLIKAVAASKRMGTSIENIRKQISNDNIISIFSVEKEIKDAIEMVQHKSREASVAIKFTAKQSIVLDGNSLKFYQVILNLLSNAIEACEGNTRKNIIHVVLNFIARRKEIVITVSDSGCGIEHEILQNIFTPFFTTKGYQKGIGLGLSQTKEIIEKDFGGTIAVTSKKNKTVFTIVIPFKDSYIYERRNVMQLR